MKSEDFSEPVKAEALESLTKKTGESVKNDSKEPSLTKSESLFFSIDSCMAKIFQDCEDIRNLERANLSIQKE